MEKILFELNLLEKSFPFIKFSFVHPYERVRIFINTIVTNTDNYKFWHDFDYGWGIENYGYTDFYSFLNKFIKGLIYWKIY